MMAACGGHEACVRLLLPLSYALSKDNSLGMTALMWAVVHGHEVCARLLLPVSDVLSQDNDGRTALMYAARNELDTCVKLLLPVSDPLAVDRDGLAASTWARKMGHESLAQFIDAYILSQNEKAGIESTSSLVAPRGRANPRL